MGRRVSLLLVVFATGCGDSRKINVHVANQSAEPVWVAGEYEHSFSGTVNPGEVTTFTVDYSWGMPMKVRVTRISDGFVVFDALWQWGGVGSEYPDPPSDIPITILP